MTFAQTKIERPGFRSALIERSELESRLGAALQQRQLVLLVAAAGYGKTAALARQLSLMPEGTASAWVKIDEEDDLARLLLCIAHALEPCDPPWRMAPEALAAEVAEKRGLRGAAAELANTLDAISVSHGVIALDDLHLVTDERVFAFIEIFLEMMPPTWTLALASRVEPPLALARLRVRGQLAEFRQDDIAFTQAEIQRLCDRHQARDDGSLAQSLYERTQGWAAGVSLSLQALDIGQWGPQAGERQGRRFLYEFLAAEVFDRMSADQQDFLVRSSVLPELTADRCAFVTGNAGAMALLEDIERRGLFVSVLDADTLTLRLHDLFRDFLEAQLRQRHAHELPVLLLRAAEGESDLVRKIHLLLRAGARTTAEQDLAAAAPQLLITHDGAQVLRLIELFPNDPVEPSPWLAYARGLWSWYQLEVRAVCETMAAAALGFERLGQVQAAQDARCFEAVARFVVGQSETAHGLIDRVRQGPWSTDTRATVELFGFLSEGYGGSPEACAAHLDRLLVLLEGGAPAVLWNRCMPRMYMLVGRPGINPLLRRFANGALSAAGETDLALSIAARQLQAWLSLWRADLAETDAAIDALHTDFRWHGHTRALRLSLRRLTVAYFAMKGDRVGMRAAWKGFLSDDFDVANVQPAKLHPDWRIDLLIQLCRYLAVLDDWQAVARLMRRIDNPRRATVFATASFGAQCCRVRFALHERRNDDALDLARTLAAISRANDRMGLDASVRICLAVAELRAGNASFAWSALVPVLDAVRSSGDHAAVLLAGQSLLDELAAAAWGDAAPAEGIEALQSWSRLARHWRSQGAPETRAKVGDGAELLTAREIDVITLIAKGQSNKLIARQLNLSPHTVKRHVARVLDRLDVRSRGEAAAAWHRIRAVVKSS